jgi:hypothetical protein
MRLQLGATRAINSSQAGRYRPKGVEHWASNQLRYPRQDDIKTLRVGHDFSKRTILAARPAGGRPHTFCQLCSKTEATGRISIRSW